MWFTEFNRVFTISFIIFAYEKSKSLLLGMYFFFILVYKIFPTSICMACSWGVRLQEMTICSSQCICCIHNGVNFSSFIFNKRLSIPATCSFEASPCPVIAILIFNGAYSCIGIS